MAEHITDEEQVEALKRWWKENGTFLVLGVAVAVAGWWGFQFWQTQQQTQKEAASALFDQMMDAGIPDPGQTITEQEITTTTSLAEELKTDYANTLYAHDAAMLLAKIAVEQNQLDNAKQQLQWVLSNNPSDAVQAVANLRLATVMYAEGSYDDAQALVTSAPDDSFASSYAELRGDINVAQNNLEQAKTEYELALDKLLQTQSNRRDIIQMKLDDILSTLAIEKSPEETASVYETSNRFNDSALLAGR